MQPHPSEPLSPPLGQSDRFESGQGRTASARKQADDAALLTSVTSALRNTHPELSAAEPMWLWQKLVLLCCPVAIGALVLGMGADAIGIVLLAIGLPFFAILVLRLLPLAYAAAPAEPPGEKTRSPDEELPTYTILVPLLAEREAVPTLIEALAALDYPSEKVEVVLLVEASDLETQQALAEVRLPGHMWVEVVPPGKPQTKPRALNYGLARSRGEFVVVFDAEDHPEPDQLRRAVAALKADPNLGCVQARLNIYNPGETWFTRQFTIEYSVLFDHVLPTLARLGLPVPLGGTSNHFPRHVLEGVGAWDPFNVTEDADLGIRLARRGWKVEILASTTWEEAPPTGQNWTGQRTRWMKGWLQTFLVHMREPRRCARELGLARFLGLQCLMGGMLLSALVDPWACLLLAFKAAGLHVFALPAGPWSAVLADFGTFNFVAAHAGGIVLGGIAARTRGQNSLIGHALWMPIYWLLISLACYRALQEFTTAPFHWAKTRHRRRDCSK